MDIVVDSLSDHSDLVEIVARWCHEAFTPAMTLAQYTAAMRTWLDENDTMFIALDGPRCGRLGDIDGPRTGPVEEHRSLAGCALCRSQPSGAKHFGAVSASRDRPGRRLWRRHPYACVTNTPLSQLATRLDGRRLTTHSTVKNGPHCCRLRLHRVTDPTETPDHGQQHYCSRETIRSSPGREGCAMAHHSHISDGLLRRL
jgi:hypothetical protein